MTGAKRRTVGQAAPREACFLRDSLLDRLNSYVLAAGAAGVAVLACSLPAEGAPICQKISLLFLGTDTYSLNPANRPVTPFNIAATFSSPSSQPEFAGARVFLTPNLQDANVVLANNGFPADLPSGASIGPGGNFGKGRSYGLLFSTASFGRRRGNLKLGEVNYFGYQFRISGQTHYGWVRMTASGDHTALQTQILDSGYETSPDTSIGAGVCETTESKGTDSAPSSVTPEWADGTLGNLAMGASGLPFRRRLSGK